MQSSDRKDLFGFWSSFISDGSGALSWSLFTIIQNDATVKVKGSSLLETQRLDLADLTVSKRPGTSF